MAQRTPLRAIRAKCLDCSYGQLKEVRLCPVTKCPLYEYRMGHRPKGEEILDENEDEEKSADFSGDFEEREDADDD